eukprot:1673028-Rhodomonas_salina.1
MQRNEETYDALDAARREQILGAGANILNRHSHYRLLVAAFGIWFGVTNMAGVRKRAVESTLDLVSKSADLASAWALWREGLDVERKEEAHGALAAAKEQIGGMKL